MSFAGRDTVIYWHNQAFQLHPADRRNYGFTNIAGPCFWILTIQHQEPVVMLDKDMNYLLMDKTADGLYCKDEITIKVVKTARYLCCLPGLLQIMTGLMMILKDYPDRIREFKNFSTLQPMGTIDLPTPMTQAVVGMEW
jgi:hypothetical protein